MKNVLKWSKVLPIIFGMIFFGNILNAQKINQSFFNDVDAFLQKYVSDGLVKYAPLKSDKKLKILIDRIASADVSDLDDKTLQAFYINAYNLNVINKVVRNYPLQSVIDKKGFFDNDKITVANASLTLNQLEKDRLLKSFNDPRFHFVLVCGAVGCPPITHFAYRPEKLEAQLEQQTKKALNDADFIRVAGNKVELSQIFKWYANDFGGSQEKIVSFINKYRTDRLSAGAKLSYYTYDWSLNDQSNGLGVSGAANAYRYIVSSTIPKGSVEIKIFNNLYSQKTGDPSELRDRSSFFTTTLSAFYGLSNRLNIGVNGRYRKVRNNALPSSPFSVFESDGVGSSRSGLTAIGPQIRYAPNPKWENFSIQSSFVFPIGEDLAGSEFQPYIDWTGATWNTQFFNDFSIGTKFSLFTEVDVLLEDIGSSDEGHINRLSTPVILIFSFIPTAKWTIYTIGGYSPFWQKEYDYFVQYGLGTKYQITSDLELELLYTDFSNKFLAESGGQAETINLGLRVNLFN